MIDRDKLVHHLLGGLVETTEALGGDGMHLVGKQVKTIMAVLHGVLDTEPEPAAPKAAEYPFRNLYTGQVVDPDKAGAFDHPLERPAKAEPQTGAAYRWSPVHAALDEVRSATIRELEAAGLPGTEDVQDGYLLDAGPGFLTIKGAAEAGHADSRSGARGRFLGVIKARWL